ncbi:MAG: hypothetical protein ACI9CD_000352 [Candidatus Deianiraeaceae bacterium]|jgi:hypothetical protein
MIEYSSLIDVVSTLATATPITSLIIRYFDLLKPKNDALLQTTIKQYCKQDLVFARKLLYTNLDHTERAGLKNYMSIIVLGKLESIKATPQEIDSYDVCNNIHNTLDDYTSHINKVKKLSEIISVTYSVFGLLILISAIFFKKNSITMVYSAMVFYSALYCVFVLYLYYAYQKYTKRSCKIIKYNLSCIFDIAIKRIMQFKTPTT